MSHAVGSLPESLDNDVRRELEDVVQRRVLHKNKQNIISQYTILYTVWRMYILRYYFNLKEQCYEKSCSAEALGRRIGL